MVVADTADSLLGRLQRGRGRGYLDALAAPSDDAQSAVRECLIRDPRTDRQVESRDEYYGRLAVDLHLDLAPLEAFLLGVNERDDAAEDDWRGVLALGALGWMGRLGRDDATQLLRRCVEHGQQWDTALESLIWPTMLDVRGLDEVISARCSLEELTRALPFGDDEPWRSWRASNARIAEAFALQDAERQEYERRDRELHSLSTAELLKQHRAKHLRGRASESDKTVLLDAAYGTDAAMRHDAIRELGWQRDPRVLDAAEAELRRYTDQDLRPNAGWFAIFQLLKDGPLPRVRRWLGEPGRPGEMAVHAVAEWPEPDDAALLRSVAERFGDKDWLYRAGDAVDALAKLDDPLAAPVLESIFQETTYSYLRSRAATALALLSPAFTAGLAIESLWDCEETTVAVGCAAATLTSEAVRSRLATLASDGFVARRIRSLAGRRCRVVGRSGRRTV